MQLPAPELRLTGVRPERLVRGLIAVTVLAGCGTASSPDAEGQLRLPTWDPPSDGVRALSVTGRLHVDDQGCVRLRDAELGEDVTPVWPEGWTAATDGGGLILTDPDGESVTVDGREVVLAGGFGDGHEDEPCVGEGPFEVDQVIRL